LVIAAAVVVVVAAWVVRVQEGRRALAACDSALARGDRVEAIVQARAAAEARCPWCSSPELGYARLYAIAKEAESHGDDATAVAAWRAVRVASIATIIATSTPARRERADVEIARLEHRIDAASAAAGGTAAPAASEERLRQVLAQRDVPSGFVFLLLAVGGALFLTGAVRFVRGTPAGITSVVCLVGGAAMAVLGVVVF
jgi:hypothetical protein